VHVIVICVQTKTTIASVHQYNIKAIKLVHRLQCPNVQVSKSLVTNSTLQ